MSPLPSLNPSLRKKVEEALSETTDEEDKPSLIVGVQVESAPNPTIWYNNVSKSMI